MTEVVSMVLKHGQTTEQMAALAKSWPASLISRFAIALSVAFFFTVLSTGLPTAAHADDAGHQRMAAVLRSRRLFDLAEAYCLDQQKSDRLTSRGTALLTIELMRVHADRAYQLPLDQQAPNWAAAQQVAEQFQQANPNHAFQRLVDVQQALTLLAHGILLRQSFQSAASPVVKQQAMKRLREASRELEALEKLIADDLLRKRPETHFDNSLDEYELRSLKNNVRFHLAETFMNRALLHDEDDQLNRIAALGRVSERLDQLLQSVGADDPLRGRVVINRLTCDRLQKNFGRAVSLLEKLASDETALANGFSRDLEAEVLRIAIERDDSTTLEKMAAVESANSEPADLKLARIEAILALARLRSDTPRAGQLQQHAVSLARQLEQQHGRYWSRRANNLLLISAAANPQSVDLSLLIKVADATYVKGDFDDAVRAYESAAGQARQTGDAAQMFDLLFKAASIQHQRRNFADSTARFQKLATENSRNPQAATAHLLAIIGTSELAQVDSQRIDDYVALLETQIAQWPVSQQTDQARVWFAAILVHRSETLPAIEMLLGVPVESPKFVEAIQTAQQRGQLLARRDLEPADRAKAIELFARVYKKAFSRTDEIPQVPDWWAMAVSADMLGRLGVPIRSVDIERLGNAVVSDEQLPWDLKVAIGSVLVYEHARAGASAKFLEQASALTELDPQQTILSLQRVMEARSLAGDVAAELPALIKQLEKKRAELTEKSQAILLTLEAQTAAATGNNDRAIELFETLIKSRPRDLAIRMEYAGLLGNSAEPGLLKKGLGQWRVIAKATRPRSDDWYTAKYNVALLLQRSGETKKANDLLVYLKEIPPGWEQSALKSEFEKLLTETSMKDGGTR